MRKIIKKFKTPIITHSCAVIGGALVVMAIEKHQRNTLHTLVLGKEAFNALINDETNFVWFATGKHDHVFHVSLAP